MGLKVDIYIDGEVEQLDVTGFEEIGSLLCFETKNGQIYYPIQNIEKFRVYDEPVASVLSLPNHYNPFQGH